MMKQRSPYFVMLLAFGFFLAGLNFLVSQHPLRVDLTDKNEYSLADVTEELLTTIDDIVTVRVYFTEALPSQLLSLRRSVEDLLGEMKLAAGQKLQVEYIDPGVSQMEEQKAMMLGIPPVQLNVVEQDRREVAKIYLGMAVLYGSKQEVLPVVQRVENLEYDLAQAILKVSTKELPKIGWWVPGAGREEREGFQGIRELLAKRSTLIDVADPVNDLDLKKISTVVVFDDGGLHADEKALFALDQFLMSGGRVIALVDRWHIASGLQLEKVSSALADLFTSYGITVDQGLVLDRSNAMASFTGGLVTYHLPYPFWPEVRPEGFAAELPMVAELESLVLPWTTRLTLAASSDERKIAAVAATTDYGVVASAEPPPNIGPEEARRLLNASGEVLPLIALASGTLKSAFADGGKTPPKGATPLTASAAEAQLLVMPTTRVVQNQFLGLFPSNAAFFENAVDSFAWGGKLIGIRSRSFGNRPIAMLSDGIRAGVRLVNLVLVPLLVLLLGIIVFFVRRARHRALRMAYQS